MNQLEQVLRQHVQGLSDDDVMRIMAVAESKDGKTLQAIADDLNVSRDGLNYSLQKVYRSPDAPGINSLADLRKWAGGLLVNPFGPRFIICTGFGNLMPTDTMVFAYGSILDPNSLASTTGQDPSSIEYVPARLENHVSEWGAPSHRLNYSDAEWKSADDVLWLWLGIRRTGNPADVVNGALVKLNGPQYRQVRARESHYRAVNVVDDVLVDGRGVNSLSRSTDNEIIAFVPDPSKLTENQAGGRTAVRAGYYDNIHEYLNRIHPNKELQLPELPAGVERLEGHPTDDRVTDVFWKTISALPARRTLLQPGQGTVRERCREADLAGI